MKLSIVPGANECWLHDQNAETIGSICRMGDALRITESFNEHDNLKSALRDLLALCEQANVDNIALAAARSLLSK